ncbi:MAG: putative transcriptional regulatory protein [Phycisphaerae bacterium]|nr:putative transcriptional regulatory protein [Phycisphaerae bacterium]
MAGHSHWARIKRAKAAVDARRGKVWTKLARAIIVAAKAGGADPDSNLALRYAIDAAKEANMPRDTIERAVKKGSGELGSESFEELLFEGYGPGGVAIMCQTLTDNRNRTAPEIKKIFELNGGNLGASNCVSWMFSKRGVIIVPKAAAGEEALTDIAIASGADDLRAAGDAFEITCDPGTFEELRAAFAAAGVSPESAGVSMVASSVVTLSGAQAQAAMKLIEALEEHDDVQEVYSNLDVSAEDLERMSG